MRSKVPLLIVVVALLIFGALVFLGIANRLRQLASNLPIVLENELQARLDRKAKAGSVRLTSPSTAVITDLRVASGKTFAEGTLFSARRAVVRFNVVDLLTGRVPLARSITSVALFDPSIRLVRDRNGVWDIEDLLRRPPVPPAQRFRGLIRVYSGGLTVVDYAARVKQLPAVNSLHSVSGYVNLAPAQSALVDLLGEGERGRVRSVRATGRWGIGAPVTRVSLSIQDANAEYWLDYCADIRPWNIRAGVVSAQAVLSQPRRAGIVAQGFAALRNSAITSPYLSIPVRPFSAKIRFFGTNISLAGRGFLRESPISIRGQVLGFHPGKLNLRIASERINLAVLQAAIEPLPAFPQVLWHSPGAINIGVAGTTRRPIVTGIVRAPRAALYGMPLTSLTARGYFRDGAIFITAADGRTAGGRISLSAAIGLKPIRIRVQGTAGGINLAALPLPRNLRATGLADLRFALDYLRQLRSARLSAEIVRGKLAGFTFARAGAEMVFTGPRMAQATLELTRSAAPGVAIEAAVADLALRGRTILVQRLVAKAFQGMLAGEGAVTLDGGLNLNLSGTGVNLGALLAPLGHKQFTGIASFMGSLTGTIGSPHFAGQATARDGRIRRVEYDFLTGYLVATPDRLIIEDAVVRLQQAEVVTSGRIVVARKTPARVEMQVRARGINLARVSARAQGIAGADLDVRGQFSNIRVSGGISVADTVIAGVPLDQVRVQLRFQKGRTVITELLARRAEMQLIGGGSIGPQGDLRISLMGENLRLSLLSEIIHPYVALEGPMTFTGEVRGTLGSPTIRAAIASTAPVVNGRQFKSLAADVRLVDGAVILDRAVISPPQGQAIAQGAINPEGLVSLTGQLVEFPLAILRPRTGAGWLAGTADASFAMVGPAGSPEVQASISAADVVTPRLSIERITAEQVTIAGGRLSSSSVRARANGNQVLLSGSLPFVWAAPFVPRDQPILLHAELPNQDFSVLETFSPTIEEAHGAFMAAVDVTGTLDQPAFNGEVVLSDGSLSLHNLENDLTNLTLAARFENSSLVVDALSGASSLGGTFSGSGNLSLTDARCLLTAFVTLNDLRLAVTSTAVEELVFTSSGQLLVTETLHSPLMRGQLAIRDARIRLPAKAVPTTVVAPQLPVNPELEITADLARDVTVERGTLRAEVIGPVAITGTLARPAIAGTVQIASGRLNYLSRTLELRPGGTASLLLSPAQPPIISVDVTAVARVSAPSPVTGLFTRYTLTLDIAGPIGNLDIDVHSSPPGLSDIEALRLVFRGTSLDALIAGRPFEQLFREQLGQVLLGLAVPRLFEPFQIEGLTFALEPGFDIPLAFTASTPLTERVILSYSRSVIGVLPFDVFSFSYTLSPQLAITAQFAGLNRTPRQTSYLLEYFRRF